MSAFISSIMADIMILIEVSRTKNRLKVTNSQPTEALAIFPHWALRMLMLGVALSTFILVALMPKLAVAADITKDTLVDGTEHFHIQGVIERGDDRTFERLSSGTQRGVVTIVSKGGSVDTAIAMGELIRARNFETLIGVVLEWGDDAYCYSACTLLYLGGRKLYSSTDATISSNLAFGNTPLPPNSPMFREKTEVVSKYLERLGYPASFISFITKPSDADYGELTFSKARQFGLTIFRKSESPFGPPPRAPRIEKKMGD